jgi:predicted HTH transcriptional regulator
MATHVLPERESKQLEFKFKLPYFKSLVKTSVAFANGVGGRIIIGVDDKTRKVLVKKIRKIMLTKTGQRRSLPPPMLDFQ